MMTNERQTTVLHLNSSRLDRQFHPYKRPAGYVRFASVPQMSAERQYLMTFMVVSRRGVTGTSPDPLGALGLWSQEEATCRILSRFSYYYIVRRDRRYHPYKRSRKYCRRQCRRTPLPLYLNCRYFSAFVQRHLNETEAITIVENEMEVEPYTKDNSTADAPIAHNAQITMLKPPDTTLELDMATSVDVSHPEEPDTPVRDWLTDWRINLLTDSDNQHMRRWEYETNVKDLSSPAQSKTITDLNTPCFDNVQSNNAVLTDYSATTNVPRPVEQGQQEVSEQVNISDKKTETVGLSETDVKQPEHEEIDNEEDLLRIDPGDNDISESVLVMSESSINQLLDEKTKDNNHESKQSIMSEKQVGSNESLSASELGITGDSEERTKEQEVNPEFSIESEVIGEEHKDQPGTNITHEETHENSSDAFATVTDMHEYSENENVALKTELRTNSNAEVGSDDNKSCDKKICLPTGNLEPNFIDSSANSYTTTAVSVSAKAWVKIENKPDCGKTAKNSRFIVDKVQNLETDKETLESKTISVKTHNKPKVPRIMYINPAMVSKLTTPSTKQIATPEDASSKQVTPAYLNPSKQSKPISSEKGTELLCNGHCETPTMTPIKLPDDSDKKTTSEVCKGITEEKQPIEELHKTRETADSSNRRIIFLNPGNTRKSAADFFLNEIKNVPETSKIPICTDGKTASARRVICLRPDKNMNLRHSNAKVTYQMKAKDREDQDDSLSVWLRKGTSLSDPNKCKQKLSDEERLQLRKRRFGTGVSNHQQTSIDCGPSIANKRRIIRLNRH